MVVDHVHHHVHADVLLDGLDHFAELQDALAALGVGGVGAFRGGVVVGVITPVEGVDAAQIAVELLHLRVLLAVAPLQVTKHGFDGLAAAAVAGELGVLHLGVDLAQLAEVIADVGDLGRILVDGGDVEHRQQVQVADSALGQRLQVLDRRRVGVGQAEELAAVLGRGGVVVAGQIADMGLIDGDVGGVLLAVGRLEAVPPFRLEGRIVEIHHLAELGVHRQAQGVGVGHLIGFQLAADRVIDLDVVAVELAHQLAATLHAPAAAGLVQGHGALAERLVLAVEQRQLDRLGGRRPQPEGDIAPLDHGAISQLGGRFAVEGIEGAGALHQGRPLQNAVGIGADGHQLTLEQRLEILASRQDEGGSILQMRILGLLLGGQAGRSKGDVGEVEHPFRVGLDGA